MGCWDSIYPPPSNLSRGLLSQISEPQRSYALENPVNTYIHSFANTANESEIFQKIVITFSWVVHTKNQMRIVVLACFIRIQQSCLCHKVIPVVRSMILWLLWGIFSRGPQISGQSSLDCPCAKHSQPENQNQNPDRLIEKMAKNIGIFSEGANQLFGRQVTICSMIGPESSSSVTKWLVAPISFTPASNAWKKNLEY